MIQRLKNTFLVLLGIKEAVYKSNAEKKNILFKNEDFLPDVKAFVEKTSIEFIFTEFGEERINAGGSKLSQNDRLEPSLQGILKFFPNAKITVYTDFDWNPIENVDFKKVNSPVNDPDHPRFGYRTGNYFKFKALSESTADFCCALDTDMYFLNTNIISLLYLAQKFGFCVAFNTRQLLRQDMKMSLDVQEIKDNSMGFGQSYNQSPMTLWKQNERGVNYYKKAMEIMQKDPSRGSLVMWKAAWETGLYPYVLPKQFCVCEGDVGCGDEVILHIGHPKVAEYYNV